MSKADQTYSPFRGESGQITMRIDPKVKYLSELAAKESGYSLAMFVELSLRRTLESGGVNDEPTPGPEPKPKHQAPLLNEGYWDDDPVNRFYLVATGMPSALTPRARKLWDRICREASRKGPFNLNDARKLLAKYFKDTEGKKSK